MDGTLQGAHARLARMDGGRERCSAASVAGSPRQKRASAGSPATDAITAMRAAVLHQAEAASAAGQAS